MSKVTATPMNHHPVLCQAQPSWNQLPVMDPMIPHYGNVRAFIFFVAVYSRPLYLYVLPRHFVSG